MGILKQIETTCERSQQYKLADLTNTVNKIFTRPAHKAQQKAWIDEVWRITYEIDELAQRDHYLLQFIVLNKSVDLTLATVFEHINWGARTQLRIYEEEQELVKNRIEYLTQIRLKYFLERPNGAYIREMTTTAERNGGRDFWEKGRKQCKKNGGCCARKCGCCVGWLLHCSKSCACCMKTRGELVEPSVSRRRSRRKKREL